MSVFPLRHLPFYMKQKLVSELFGCLNNGNVMLTFLFSIPIFGRLYHLAKRYDGHYMFGVTHKNIKN